MKLARENDGAPTPRKKLNGSSRSATTYIYIYTTQYEDTNIEYYKQRSSKPVSYTHTDQELQANQRQAAPSTECRS